MNTDTIKSLRRIIRELKAGAKMYRHMANRFVDGTPCPNRGLWETGEHALLFAIKVVEGEILRQKSGNREAKTPTGVR